RVVVPSDRPSTVYNPISTNRPLTKENIDVCHRNPAGKIKKPKIASNSLSSAGTILCCSSLKSSDIRNCNKQIQARREKEVSSKLWKGATELGVVGEACEEDCVHHILANERRDEEGRIRREQQQHVNQ
ncbi:hypothetical protein A2U01_0035379, partial [Trifolium medium]|nr:hypothetical protein [Trifolium medium]